MAARHARRRWTGAGACSAATCPARPVDRLRLVPVAHRRRALAPRARVAGRPRPAQPAGAGSRPRHASTITPWSTSIPCCASGSWPAASDRRSRASPASTGWSTGWRRRRRPNGARPVAHQPRALRRLPPPLLPAARCCGSTSPERPEDVQRISPHRPGQPGARTCSSASSATRSADPAPSASDPTSAGRPTIDARLDEIADEVFAEYEQRGLTGRDPAVGARPGRHPARPARLPRRRRPIPGRARRGARARRAALRPRRRHPGRPSSWRAIASLTFKGSADRVDLADDGVARGRSTTRPAATEAYRRHRPAGDPVVRRHQAAAPDLRPGRPQPLRCRCRCEPAYWFVSERGGFDQIGYPLDRRPASSALRRRARGHRRRHRVRRLPGPARRRGHPLRHSFENCTLLRLRRRSAPPIATGRGSGSATPPQLAAYVAPRAEGEPTTVTGAVATPTTLRPATRSATTSTHPVRRGRGRHRQDHRAGRSHRRAGGHGHGPPARHRRHHLHRGGRRRAARPRPRGARAAGRRSRRSTTRSTPADHRRRRSRARVERARRGPGRGRRRRHQHPARVRPAHPGRAPVRGRAARPPSRSTTRSGPGGLRRAVERLPRPAPRRSRRHDPRCSGPWSPASRSTSSARWPSSSTATGTWSPTTAVPPPSPRPPVEAGAVIDGARRQAAAAGPAGAPTPTDKLLRPRRRPGRLRPTASARPTADLERLQLLAQAPGSGLQHGGRKDNWDGSRRRGARPPGRGPGRQRRTALRRASRAGPGRPAGGHPRAHARGGGRRAPTRRHPRVPRPAGAGPPPAAHPARGRRPASTPPTPTCSSTSSRTPIPSRSSWPCASPPTTPTPTAKPWTELAVPAGRLFFVGDPKQAIYRFRRADIGLFLEVRDRLRRRPRSA